ncbi:MAG: RNA polymerase subunit sigma [Chloroflexi bacterium]|nr:MAG: RNA polymerase subunit sigma [Chloroflexota bacterium]
MEFKPEEQSNKIQKLLRVADEQGYLTFDQIWAVFPEAEDDTELLTQELEDFFFALYEQGIDVYESEEEAVEEQAEELEEAGPDEDQGDAFDLSDIPVDDAVGLYFSEMSHVPLLTREEEIELAKRLERGRKARAQLDRNGHDPQERERLKRLIEEGEEARRHLIEANTRLVVSIAKKYRGQGMPFLDLIQAGNVGLIRAVDKYDYRRGTKFSTHATWWIRQAVTRTLNQQGRIIRIPVHMGDRIRRLHRTAQKLEQDIGRPPTPEEIAEEVDLTPDEVRWLLRVSRRPVSLDRPVGEEKDSELGDFIEDEDTPLPTQRAELHLLRENLEEMLTNLSPREVRILRLRFGLQGEKAHTLREVGEKLGVSRERVRQIEAAALRKLRHPRYRRRLRDYLS